MYESGGLPLRHAAPRRLARPPLLPDHPPPSAQTLSAPFPKIALTLLLPARREQIGTSHVCSVYGQRYLARTQTAPITSTRWEAAYATSTVQPVTVVMLCKLARSPYLHSAARLLNNYGAS